MEKATAVPGHPGIFQKGSRYQVRYRHNGRQVAKSFRTLTEARRFRGRVQAGETRPTNSEPFRSYASRWLDTYSGRTNKGLAASTRAAYRDAVERLAVPYFGTRPLDRIDPPALRGYIRHLEKQGLTPAAVRKYYAPVRAMLATAYEDGQLNSNPAAGVRVIVQDTRERVPMWLSPEQTRALLAAMPDDHADLALFLATTGTRISEALRVRWRDIARSEAGRIAVTITTSKTEAGLRTITLSPGMARALVKRRAESAYAAGSDLVFPSRTGTVQDARNWRRRVFKQAAELAGVPWATPHKLRHGVASMIAAEGRSASEIAAHLGHADGGVLALRTYVHPDGLHDVSFIDRALGSDA